MPELTVTVSDKVFKKIKKDQDPSIFSKVCEEAITSEIRYQKLISKSETNPVITRLKNEKNTLTKASRIKGKEEGIKLAPFLSYIQIREFYKFKKSNFNTETDDFDDTWDNDVLINALDYEFPESVCIINHTKDGVQYANFEAYLKHITLDYDALDIRQILYGFVNGVISFYDSIKDEIGDDIWYEINGD